MTKSILIFILLSLNFLILDSVYAVSVPILMYHYIGNNPNPKDTARNTLSVSPDNFEAQMNYLKSHGFTAISLDTMYGIFNHQTSAPAKPIVLTFDDGYIDFYTTAYPILRKYNMHAVSFIATGLVGGSYYMNWSQIEQLQNRGGVTFEAHSVTHPSLAALPYNLTSKELKDSRDVLFSHTHYPVNFVAYPNGSYNGMVIDTVKKLGYAGALSTRSGRAFGPSYTLPRIRITGQMNLKTFASYIGQ